MSQEITGAAPEAANGLRNSVDATRAWLRTEAATRWLLAGLIVIGALLRLTNLNWDQFTHIHPDERFLTMVTSAMKLPESLGQFFDSSQSPMNPYNIGYNFFVYGTLPLFIVRVVAEIAQKINEFAQIWESSPGMPIFMTGYDGVHLVGRFVSGLFDLMVVPLAFFIGRRLYNSRVGLLAATFYTFSVLALQQSHFYTVDTFGTFFAALTFYFAVRVAQGADPARQSGWGSYVGLGLSLGMALACRINLAPMAAIAILGAGVRAWDEISDARAAGGKVAAGWMSNMLQASLFRLILMVVVAGVTFRIFQPYSFAGNSLLSFSLSEGFRDSMRTINFIIKGEADQPPMHQWANRTPFVFPLSNMIVWGMGIFLGVTAWIGWAVAALQIALGLTIRPNASLVKAHLLPVAWIGGMFVYHSMQFSYTMRYYLPIYPMLAILAAWLLWWLADRARHWEPATTAPHWVRSVRRVFTAPVAYALVALVTVATMLWGWGFLAIYRRPLTRATASEWIYANVPEGAVVANEHWDDPLPFSLDGKMGFKPSGMYYGLTLPDGRREGQIENYGEDTPEKREAIYRWLNDADILVLSSNRLWGSIPRLPMRFPMTKEYYQLLFDGMLGFELAGRFTSFPTIFGIPFDDTGAEEAFSVYDHPEVRIYRKTDAYSDDVARSYFEQIDLENTIQMWPKQVTQAPTALLLTPEEYATQQTSGTWWRIFDADGIVNASPVLSVVVWLALLLLLGLIAFPITFVVLARLSDRGWGVSRTLGMLLLAWLAWFAPALKLTSYSRPWIALCLGLLVGFSAVIGWRRWGMIREFIRERKNLLLTEEVIFLAMFLLFLLIRVGNPDLWHPARGGEKPMEFAYLNAIIRSTVFPPYDPWHAGGYINYYYFGWVIVGTLIKLTGIVPWVAYNLAVPSLFALTGVGAFSVAYALADGDRATRLAGDDSPRVYGGMRTGSLLAGLAGLFFVTIIGNMGNLKLLADQFSQRSTVAMESSLPGVAKTVAALSGVSNVVTGKASLEFPNDWWFWNASRVIPDTINEFPFFTFTYADLHAHMIALPFTLLALAITVALALQVPRLLSRPANAETWRLAGEPSPWAIPLRELMPIVLLGFVVGSLRATNTWDFPTYALAGLLGLIVLEITRRGPLFAASGPDGLQEWLAFILRSVVSVVWRFIILFAVGAVAFYPYTSNYASAYAGLQMHTEGKTAIGDYLTHWGFFIALAIVFLAAEWNAQHRERRLPRWLGEAAPAILAAAVVILGGGWVLGVRVWLVALPLAFVATILALGRDLPPSRRLALLLLGLALAITMGVEVLRQKDDIGRMNTVFKFYLQAWTLFGVSLAYGLANFAGRAERRRFAWGKLAWAVVGVLFIATMLYPPFAARAKIRDRFSAEASPRGLDGMAYMDRAQYFDNGRDLLLSDDKAAMLWLMGNVEGSPTILEAQIPEYRWGSRFSVYTGLPAVQGWNWHQRQQRSVVPSLAVERRVNHVQEIYNTSDLARARDLLDHYGVRYIIAGEQERAYYNEGGLAKFGQLEAEGYLRTAYQGGAVTIYEIVGQNRGPVESYAYFLRSPFAVSGGGNGATTFLSPRTFESPAMQ
jgi:YYY domain-containing protein